MNKTFILYAAILIFCFYSRFATDTDVLQEVKILQIARRQTLDFAVQRMRSTI
jgi:hypothetical protein